MDPPRHDKIRKLVSAAFTPRQIRRIDDQIKANAAEIVHNLAAAGSGVDFVAHCASQLPIRTLSDMMGIPAEERETVANDAEALVSAGDPAYVNGRAPLEVLFEASARLHQIAFALAARRRTDPQDDLMTNLVQADIDGEQLTNEEIAAFFVLLAVAGNDTTRQTTSHAMKALTDSPAQREWLMADFEGRIQSAVEEFVRWSSPVMTFRRTAVTDTEISGQPIAAGEKVVMFYASGNWDTELFTDPGSFNLSRNPNPHVAFGGGGTHYCLGSQVAKAQLRAIFGELLTQLPDIEAGDPELLAGNFIHAVRAMPCTFTA
jgi:cytochrome P450